MIEYSIYRQFQGQPLPVSFVSGEIADTQSFIRIGEPKGHLAFGGLNNPIMQVAVDNRPAVNFPLQPYITIPVEVPMSELESTVESIMPVLKAYIFEFTLRPST